MTQALYAHMNNKTIKKKERKKCEQSDGFDVTSFTGPLAEVFT
jgi:hypothetical protein